MPRSLALALSFIALSSGALFAADTDNLREVRDRLSDAQHSSQALLKERASLQHALKDVQEHLVATTAALQTLEARRKSLHASLARTKADIIAAELRLFARENEQHAMLQAMLRVSAVPKEAWLVMPVSLGDMVRGSHALNWSQQQLHGERLSLKAELVQLSQLRDKQEQLQLALAAEHTQHQKALGDMKAGLSARKGKLSTIGAQYQRKMREVAYLASREESMQSLLGSISEGRRVRLGKLFNKPSKAAPAQAPTSSAQPAIKKGSLQLPIQGIIRETFGASKAEGKLEGMLLEASTNHVVAPHDGEVVYSGPFLQYERMIIIRHSEHFHSLLAGMADNIVQPGQFVLKGEPVAMMQKDGQRLTNLYVELRKNAKPIDPSPWFTPI